MAFTLKDSLAACGKSCDQRKTLCGWVSNAVKLGYILLIIMKRKLEISSKTLLAQLLVTTGITYNVQWLDACLVYLILILVFTIQHPDITK